MNEIEQAIRFLEKNRDAIQDKDNQLIPQTIKDKVSMPYDLAIQALQEKAEREKGCEHCNSHVPINNFTKDYSIEVDDTEISLWEDLKCLAYMKINDCPMCGRKLVEE